MLFLDGHTSHNTPELVNNAYAKNIKILSYPSHTTHVLQGLDVVCFARLKQKHAEKIHEFKENNNLPITHKSFLHTFGPAFLEAFTPETVKAAFSATSLYPFKRDVVSSEKMGPSEALTTNPSIQGTLTTPVQKAISAFSNYRSPSSEQTEEEPMPSQAFVNDMTPTKRAKILRASLKTSSSTSFLVLKAPVHASSVRVHQPNYKKPPAALSDLDFSAGSGDEADILSYPILYNKEHGLPCLKTKMLTHWLPTPNSAPYWSRSLYVFLLAPGSLLPGLAFRLTLRTSSPFSLSQLPLPSTISGFYVVCM